MQKVKTSTKVIIGLLLAQTLLFVLVCLQVEPFFDLVFKFMGGFSGNINPAFYIIWWPILLLLLPANYFWSDSESTIKRLGFRVIHLVLGIFLFVALIQYIWPPLEVFSPIVIGKMILLSDFELAYKGRKKTEVVGEVK